MLTFLWNTVKSSIQIVTDAKNWLNGNKKRRKQIQHSYSSSPNRQRTNSGELYAFHIDGNNYKVGKTINLTQRVRSYKTIHPKGSVKHTVKVSDIHHTERILHDLLKMRGCHVTQEIYCLPLETLKIYMNLVAELGRIVMSNDGGSRIGKAMKMLKTV